MSEITKCKNSIGGIKGRVTYYKNLLESETEFSQGEYESMLDRIKALFVKFDEVQAKLEDFDPAEFESDARDDFEARCRNVEAIVRNKLRELNKGQFSSQGTDAHSNLNKPLCIPLPEIPLPKFNGSFLSWLEFREIYLQRIHNDCRLDSLLKFTYLQDCLKGGTAYQFIDGIPNTEQNYDAVWKSLFKHYENEPRIKTLHMQLLYDLKPVKQENCAVELKIFIESFWKQFNALKTFKAPVEHWDLLLVYHVTQLIDVSSRQQIEIKRSLEKDLTITEVMDILSNRARLLEAMSPIVSKKTNIERSTGRTHKSVQSLVSNVDNPISCNYCKANHFIYKCNKFIALPWKYKNQCVHDRKLCINCFGSHYVSNCKSKVTCIKCKRRPNTLLHISNYQPFPGQSKDNTNVHDTDSIKSQPIQSGTQSSVNTDCSMSGKSVSSKATELKNETSVATISLNRTYSLHACASQVLLFTVLVWVESDSGVKMQCRALLDSGSQSNFVTENICHKLKANKKSICIPVTGINQNIIEIKNQVNLSVESRFQNYKTHLNFLVLSKITSDLPLHPIKFDPDNLPKSINLADPKFFIPDRIDLLLGAEIYAEIFTGEKIKIYDELPPFQESVFGYVICGRIQNPITPQTVSLFCCDVEQIRKEVQKFFVIEDVEPRNNFSIEEKACELHYTTNVKRDGSGRYSVALPTKENITNLANKQFLYLEKRFVANPKWKDLYCEFIEEYISLNHMQLTTNIDSDLSYFLPHHAVMKESSTTTKLRVVFNASSKSESGISLNDCLMTGPTIQPDLFSLFIRFRKYPIALTADITKMYRQINVREADRKLQQIWWRKNPTDPCIYQLNTVTYGTGSAPFLAIRSLKQLAIDEHNQFPQLSYKLLNDFYVDDFSSGAENINEAKILKTNITSLLAKGGFELTKWASNNKEVVLGETDCVGILGIQGNCRCDTINITLIKEDIAIDLRKRAVLSLISQIFDRLGLCGPVVFVAKTFMQKLWSIPQLNWDRIL